MTPRGGLAGVRDVLRCPPVPKQGCDMAVSSFLFGGHAFEPLAERALHWPARRTIILSDLHVGKAAVFRARGLPVPTGCDE